MIPSLVQASIAETAPGGNDKTDGNVELLVQFTGKEKSSGRKLPCDLGTGNSHSAGVDRFG